MRRNGESEVNSVMTAEISKAVEFNPEMQRKVHRNEKITPGLGLTTLHKDLESRTEMLLNFENIIIWLNLEWL